MLEENLEFSRCKRSLANLPWNVMGYIKGKSAIAIARRFGGRVRNFTGEGFLGSRVFCFDGRA